MTFYFIFLLHHRKQMARLCVRYRWIRVFAGRTRRRTAGAFSTSYRVILFKLIIRIKLNFQLLFCCCSIPGKSALIRVRFLVYYCEGLAVTRSGAPLQPMQTPQCGGRKVKGTLCRWEKEIFDYALRRRRGGSICCFLQGGAELEDTPLGSVVKTIGLHLMNQIMLTTM